ncbi:hypothetical protein W04_2711 [Pseudoalteromonas sp. SW0106-04]|nr:hypothetical protein W04_2711 [Pseudoalteromonas sp. SW0106-04]
MLINPLQDAASSFVLLLDNNFSIYFILLHELSKYTFHFKHWKRY